MGCVNCKFHKCNNPSKEQSSQGCVSKIQKLVIFFSFAKTFRYSSKLTVYTLGQYILASVVSFAELVYGPFGQSNMHNF